MEFNDEEVYNLVIPSRKVKFLENSTINSLLIFLGFNKFESSKKNEF